MARDFALFWAKWH